MYWDVNVRLVIYMGSPGRSVSEMQCTVFLVCFYDDCSHERERHCEKSLWEQRGGNDYWEHCYDPEFNLVLQLFSSGCCG